MLARVQELDGQQDDKGASKDTVRSSGYASGWNDAVAAALALADAPPNVLSRPRYRHKQTGEIISSVWSVFEEDIEYDTATGGWGQMKRAYFAEHFELIADAQETP
jgi:hypothetical protein